MQQQQQRCSDQMAVAMEVAWRGSAGGDQLQLELDVMRSSAKKKRAWGADTEKLMELMRAKGRQEQTLDLLGEAVGSGAGLDPRRSVVDEFDSDQPLLPSGWEKCLDLKTGEVYFVSKATGVRTSEDPRKHPAVIAPRTPARPAHEFLASKKVEALRACTPSGSSSGEEGANNHVSPPAVAQRLSFAAGKRLWSLQLDDRDRDRDRRSSSWGASPRALPFSNSPPRESNLELNLNLSPSPVAAQAQAVCTMEMVQHALKRSSEKAQGKREATSATSSFSSWSRSSPSPSSSSCSAHERVNCAAAETSTSGAAAPLELVMAACTRCPMIVMVNKQEPKCPRCESEVGLESFGAHVVPLGKRPRVEAPPGRDQSSSY